jgi:hypothetical protein
MALKLLPDISNITYIKGMLLRIPHAGCSARSHFALFGVRQQGCI